MTNFLQARVLAFTDSQVIIAQVDKGDLSSKTKHLRLAFQAVLERVTDNDIMLQHVPGAEIRLIFSPSLFQSLNLRSMWRPFSTTTSSLSWSGSRASMTDLSALRTT